MCLAYSILTLYNTVSIYTVIDMDPADAWEQVKEKTLIRPYFERIYRERHNDSIECRLVISAFCSDRWLLNVTDMYKWLTQALYGPGRCRYTTRKNIERSIERGCSLDIVDRRMELDYMSDLGRTYCRVHLDRIIPKICHGKRSDELFESLADVLVSSAKVDEEPPYPGLSLGSFLCPVMSVLPNEHQHLLRSAKLPDVFEHSMQYKALFNPLYITCHGKAFQEKWHPFAQKYLYR